jgi:hypothetical protein
MSESVQKCPNGHRLATVESSPKQVGWLHTVWRRKRCTLCGFQIKTLELPIEVATEVLSDD